MAFYIVNQLRGWAGALQAEEAKPGVAEAKGKEAYGLAHNLGLGLSCQNYLPGAGPTADS